MSAETQSQSTGSPSYMLFVLLLLMARAACTLRIRARYNLPDIEEGGAVPTALSDTAGSHVSRREREVWVVRDDGRKNG
jgi:hypothetical protein